jgi:hypothetical protein
VHVKPSERPNQKGRRWSSSIIRVRALRRRTDRMRWRTADRRRRPGRGRRHRARRCQASQALLRRDGSFARRHVPTEVGEEPGHPAGGAEVGEAQLGMRVQIPAPRDGSVPGQLHRVRVDEAGAGVEDDDPSDSASPPAFRRCTTASTQADGDEGASNRSERNAPLSVTILRSDWGRPPPSRTASWRSGSPATGGPRQAPARRR